MILRRSFTIFLLALLCYSCSVAGMDGMYSVKLQHSFDQGKTWTDRCLLSLSTIRYYVNPDTPLSGAGSHVEISDHFPMTRDMKASLLDLAGKRDLYFYRIQRNLEHADGNFVVGIAPACELVLSQLSDVLQLTIDPSKSMALSVSSAPLLRFSDPDCTRLNIADELDLMSDNFNTTLRTIEPVEGPVPDTQTYLEMQEQDRRRKEQGEGQDNRSFFAKYWMYIVPVLIFLLLSGSSQQDQGGQ